MSSSVTTKPFINVVKYKDCGIKSLNTPKRNEIAIFYGGNNINTNSKNFISNTSFWEKAMWIGSLALAIITVVGIPIWLAYANHKQLRFLTIDADKKSGGGLYLVTNFDKKAKSYRKEVGIINGIFFRTTITLINQIQQKQKSQ